MAKDDLAQGGAEPKPRSGKRLLLFVILPLVLLLIGAGAYFFLFMKKKDDAHAEDKPQPAKTFVYYNLPAMTVPLNGSAAGRRASFLNMTISLELDSAADVALVQAVMPRIVDYIGAFLRELRPDDLKGTAGLTRVREELLSRVTAAAPRAKVNDVLFQDVLLQ